MKWVAEVTPAWVLRNGARLERLRWTAKQAQTFRRRRSASVAFLPGHAEQDVTRACAMMATVAESVCCHVPARRFEDERHVKRFFGKLLAESNGRVTELLILGGDRTSSSKGNEEMDSALHVLKALMEDRKLCENFSSIGVAGYPDGHAAISDESLSANLRAKVDLARSSGLQVYIVTQLCLSPASVSRWHASLQLCPVTKAVPIRVGVFGPCSFDLVSRLSRRLQFGKQVDEQLRLLESQHEAFQPEDIVVECISNRLISAQLEGFQVSTFDKVARSLDWMEKVVEEKLSVQ